MNRVSDLSTLEEAKPFIRSLAAFVIYLRYGPILRDVKRAYSDADLFLAQLKEDLKP